ncbi:hypothetical protein E1162_14055 [Rhodobacteraceae bacterium RKSG542]|uniref:hypothetical protein n=1 Tax=Pseudovibrio flavus TaxID=2529854 RepID=UPI0012BB5186|nr:hypothetical protein [Pseudovibrio flavus]MTI18363.1 hypothetical protein [Pseudovibrio flavus]
MTFLFAIPLTVLPLALYNLFVFGLLGAPYSDPWSISIVSFTLASGATMVLHLSDLFLALSLLILFIELMKATRAGRSSIIDHMISTLVLLAYLVEFLTVQQAATSVFFLLMIIAALDVMAGFAISLTGVRRDVVVGAHH